MTTRPIPRELIEAAGDALNGQEATSTSGYYAASHRIDSAHCQDLAQDVLAAVLPLIRDDIARRIMTLLPHEHWCRYRPAAECPHGKGEWCWHCECRCAIGDAARIAQEYPQ